MTQRLITRALVVLAGLASCRCDDFNNDFKGTRVQDLHREYGRIFRHGNRNAASHLWASFLLDRAAGMTHERFVDLFKGFCAVSGSPVTPSDYKRYRLTLPHVVGGLESGIMYYCCWPCVCDTQDFIRIDTLNVTTLDGMRQYRFAVLGNPCSRPEMLDAEFLQPFDGRMTTLRREAPEVRCDGPGPPIGATVSDHGYTIMSMFFDVPDAERDTTMTSTVAAGEPSPGRMTERGEVAFQDEYEFGEMCRDRAANGYNSGMGEIFRKVAAISPILVPGGFTAPGARPAKVAEGEYVEATAR